MIKDKQSFGKHWALVDKPLAYKFNLFSNNFIKKVLRHFW
jgi:hypothetical protein